MMLARQDLLRAWKRGELRFVPDISVDQINLSSVDLRLGYIFTKQKAQSAVVWELYTLVPFLFSFLTGTLFRGL